jgi:cytochrome oxidase Cu insertion factor (SCO1/SenC/PrrC family)
VALWSEAQYIPGKGNEVTLKIFLPAIGIFLLLSAAARSETAAAGGLTGAVYTPPVPAADFILTDQNGKPFHMAAMAGKVVVFTFIYTHCMDVCPYVSLKLKAALGLLGPQAARVELVAVTSDPQRDTPQVMAEYSRKLGLFDTWHFVTGSPKDVRAVWSRYLASPAPIAAPSADAKKVSRRDVSASLDDSRDAAQHGQALGPGDLALAAKIISAFGGGYDVEHFSAIHFIDRHGRIRVTLDQDALPAEIASNVRTLLAEP